MSDNPLQSLFDVGEGASAGIGEHFQNNDVRPRGDATVKAVLRRDDARHMRAVARSIRSVIIAVPKVVLVDDSICDAITVHVRSEERMIDINACINHDHAVAGTIQARELRVSFQFVEINQILSRSCRRTGDFFAGKQQFDARTGQCDLRCAGGLIGDETVNPTDSCRRVCGPCRAWEGLLEPVRRCFEDDVGSRLQIDKGVRAIRER